MESTHFLNPRLLAILGRRSPALYDIIPRGPLSRFSSVMLNPQPLPPHEWGAALASEVIHDAFLADRLGLDMERVFTDLDDWCPTVPKRLKLPPWWPPLPEPDPQPDWFIDFHLGFASRLAAVSQEGTRMSESLGRIIQRSVSAIESALTNQ
jgi:hypothetical protein